MDPNKYQKQANEIERYAHWYDLEKEIMALVEQVIKDTEEECMKKYTVGDKK
jgi:hypothetical protein